MSSPQDFEQLLNGWEAPVYYGEPHEDVKVWLNLIQAGCEKRSILEDSFPTVSRRFLGEKSKDYITKCERSFTEISPDFKWNWKAFKIAMIAMTHKGDEKTGESTGAQPEGLLGEAWDETNRLISEHPVAAKAAGAILLAASAPLLAPIASAGALSMLGFGSTGPVMGTIVASVESTMLGGAVGSNPVTSVAQVAISNRITVASAATKAVAAVIAAMVAAIKRWFSRGGKRDTTSLSASSSTNPLNPECETDVTQKLMGAGARVLYGSV